MFGIHIKIALISICVFVLYSAGHTATLSREVRVGFFPLPGFHQYDKSGDPVGYDVEYLQRLRAYTGWNCRYIRTESWDQALNMLAEGKLDLVGSAQLNAERMKRFDYSAHPAGITHAAIITLSANDKVSYDDANSFVGLRFGCVRSYIRTDEFLLYAQKKSLKPEIIWFDTTEQMRKALRAREVDAMVGSIMELEDGEKVVAEFAPAPFFYITTKGNGELLAELNAALERLRFEDPHFENQLMDYWYPVIRQPSFSLEELHYAKKHSVLRVGYFSQTSPLSYVDLATARGNPSGILPEIINLLGKESGLTIEAVPVPLGVVPANFLEEGHIDAIAGMTAFPNGLHDPALRFSEPILSGRLVFVVRRKTPLMTSLPLKVVVHEGFTTVSQYIKATYPHFTIMEAKSPEACLEAVRTGEADVSIHNSHVFERFLSSPRYKSLMVLPTMSVAHDLVLALPANVNPILASLLDKSIRRLSPDILGQIVVNHTVIKPHDITFEDFLQQYRTETLVGSGLLTLCLIILAAYVHQRQRNNKIIKENAENLRKLTDSIHGGVITVIADQGFTITYANNGFLELMGYTREQFESEPHQECVAHVHPDDVPLLTNALTQGQRSGCTVTLELRFQHKNGSYIPVMFRGTVAKSREDQTILFCVVMDISEHHKVMEKIQIEKERYQIVVEQSNDIIFEVDMIQQSLMCSPRFKDKFGWQMESDDISAETPYPLQVHPEDLHVLQEIVKNILQGERSQQRQLRIRRIDGEFLWCRLLVSSVRRDGILVKLIGKIEDVDEIVRERQRLEEASRTDALCGLYNKRALRMSVEHILKNSANSRAEGALFFIDIDNFKTVNDVLGHTVGDEVLCEVSSVLRQLFRSEDIMGRFGGDEFCIFAARMSEAMASDKAREINERLKRTWKNAQGQSVDVSVSIGIACGNMNEASYDVLLDRADKALYAAKSNGKGQFMFFTSSATQHHDATPAA